MMTSMSQARKDIALYVDLLSIQQRRCTNGDTSTPLEVEANTWDRLGDEAEHDTKHAK